MRYQELKIRDATRVAAIGLACAVVAGAYFAARPALLPVFGDHFSGYAGGIAAMAPIAWGVCMWYMLSSPEQNFRFLVWAKRNNFQQQRAKNFDWKLLDASDPDYRVPTYKYAIRRWRSHSAS